ncbi:MAG: tRNA epoxyqueuosine(34) reductase QueG [Gammaproteobacteria bacterium]|nr:tRNA epoxyqueuosine(34) reductase QueG [Gammaproteobacteria bacterium]
MHALAARIKTWSCELGFEACGISDTALEADEAHLLNWLQQGRHGEMGYMARHGTRRSRPADLVPGTLRVISVRKNYFPPGGKPPRDVLDDPGLGYVSRYALGRDYHKTIRRRLQRLADLITAEIGAFGYRAFVDSAPVLEKALAQRAGLGWIGKHSNLLTREAGSWFFLGELYTDLPLPAQVKPPQTHCGNCTACIDACPTRAIVAPFQVDARLCISYLTIELHGAIPQALRGKIGNRIFGCDDCQLVCPWNRFSTCSSDSDFAVRHDLDRATLVDLFAWSEAEFASRTEGSAIRRIGYLRWLRNIAVALGNAPTTPEILSALRSRAEHDSPLVREHVAWALAQHAPPR